MALLLCAASSALLPPSLPPSLLLPRPRRLSLSPHPTMLAPGLALTCGSDSVWTVAGASGTVALLSQLALSYSFGRSADPVLSDEPGFTAHQVVAIMYMLLASVVGGAAFLSGSLWPTSAEGALLTPDGTTRFLAAVLFGELVCWDIPTCIQIPKLRKQVDILVHHVAMAVVAYVAMMYAPIFYGCFYFGISEASTVPLSLNEGFAAAHDSLQKADPDSPRLGSLASLRDAFQVLAALSFVAFRGIGFTWVTCCRLLPDTLAVIHSAGSLKLPLLFHLGAGIAFNALQLYWLFLLVMYTVRSGFGGSRSDSGT